MMDFKKLNTFNSSQGQGARDIQKDNENPFRWYGLLGMFCSLSIKDWIMVSRLDVLTLRGYSVIADISNTNTIVKKPSVNQPHAFKNYLFKVFKNGK